MQKHLSDSLMIRIQKDVPIMNLIIIHRFSTNFTVLSEKAYKCGPPNLATEEDEARRSQVQTQLWQLRPCLKTTGFLTLLYLLFICVRMCSSGMQVEDRGQLMAVGSPPQPHRSWESNSGCQSWWQIPSPAKPSV